MQKTENLQPNTPMTRANDLDGLIAAALPGLHMTPALFAEMLPELDHSTVLNLLDCYEYSENEDIWRFLDETFKDFRLKNGIAIYPFLNKQEPIEYIEARIADNPDHHKAAAILDILDRAYEKFPAYAAKAVKNLDPARSDKAFRDLISPHAKPLMQAVMDHPQYGESLIGPVFATFAELTPAYTEMQQKGLEKFAALYIDNFTLLRAISKNIADLEDESREFSLALDFNRDYEILKLKRENALIIENMLAQSFGTQILKNALNSEPSFIAMHEDGKITYGTAFLPRIDESEFLDVIMHEFCHHLQDCAMDESLPEPDNLNLQDWRDMALYFRDDFYKNPSASAENTLYRQNVTERDANRFAAGGAQILKDALNAPITYD